MAITKVWIEKDCTSCGLCSDICPEVFVMKDLATIVQDLNYVDYEEKIKEAAESCPVEVIRYIE
jgi:ferredoxin